MRIEEKGQAQLHASKVSISTSAVVPWQAEIKIGRRKQYLGSFGDETQAALAYNAAAKQLFGDFAKLNHVA